MGGSGTVTQKFYTPTELGILSQFVSPDDEVLARYPLADSIRFKTTEDGAWQASATDGNFLAIFTGKPPPKEVAKSGFPAVASGLPKGEPLARVRVNPARLAKLLAAAAELCPGEPPSAFLEFHGEGVPLLVRAMSSRGEFVGALMPLRKSQGADDEAAAEPAGGESP
jgi:hypothetical protein